MAISKRVQEFFALKSREDLASFLGIPLQIATHLAYSKREKYKKFILKKKDGTDREILAPLSGLKTVQNTLRVILEEVYNAPTSAYGFIKDKDAVKNASQHLRKKIVLNLDLKDFFPSINAGRVYGLFQAPPFSFNQEVASTLTGLVCYKNFLPQGSPVSPVISNCIAFRLDRKLMELAKSDRLTYTRYADDITFSTTSSSFPKGYFLNDNGAVKIDTKVSKIVTENGFTINEKKNRVYLKNDAHYVTGVKVNTKLNVSWKLVRQIWAMLHAWDKFTLDRAEEHFNSLYNKKRPKSFISVVRGKIEYVRHVKTDLDFTYRKLYNKFVELEGRGRPTLPTSQIDELFSRIKIIQAGTEQGTGFALEGEYVVTCAHTVKSKVLGDEVLYFGRDEFALASRHRGKVIYKNLQSDVAIISLSRGDTRSRASSFSGGYAGTDFEVENKFRAIGFPDHIPGKPPSVINVSVSTSFSNKYGITEIYTDRIMQGGMSGGAVLDSENRIVGMLTRAQKEMEYSLFIPFHYINQSIIQSGKTSSIGRLVDVLSLLKSRKVPAKSVEKYLQTENGWWYKTD